MKTLSGIERDFQALVLYGTSGIEREVAGTERVPVATRLEIYTNAYVARLTEALENNYPALSKLLGERQFAELSRAYIGAHPSIHFSVRWFGADLPVFLAATDPYAAEPVLTELACWEWNMASTFDAADAPVLTAAMLGAHPPESWGELRFVVQPSLRQLSLRTNASAVWRALNRDEPPPPVVLETAGQDWLLWRRGLESQYRSMNVAEALAFHALRSGESFAALCEGLAAEVGEDSAAVEAAGLLARWVEEEVLTAAVVGARDRPPGGQGAAEGSDPSPPSDVKVPR